MDQMKNGAGPCSTCSMALDDKGMCSGCGKKPEECTCSKMEKDQDKM